MLSIILLGNTIFNSLPRKVSVIIGFSFNFNSKHLAIKIWCWGGWQFWHWHKCLCRMICNQLKYLNDLQEHNFELESSILLFSLDCSFLAIKLTMSAIFSMNQVSNLFHVHKSLFVIWYKHRQPIRLPHHML